MKFRKAAALFMASAMVVSLSACGGSSSTTTTAANGETTTAANGETTTAAEGEETTTQGALVEKDELIIGTTNEVTVPFDNFDNNNVNGAGLCYDYLVYLNHDGELESDILESWEYTDDTTIVMKLKDGVTFSNGDKLTAEDIVYSFQGRVEAGLPQTEDFQNFDWENAEISDDGLTLTVKTFDVYAPGLVALSSKTIESKAIHEQYDVSDEYWWTTSTGTGPYKLVEQVDGAYATYELRDDYWDDTEYMFKTITFKHYGEATALFIDYQNGNVDVALNLDAYSYSELQAGTVADTVVMTQPQGNYDELHMNPNTVEAWNDVNFRLAVAHAIDWDALAVAAYDGLAQPVDSIFTSTCVGYKSEGVYEYDLDLAKEYLAKTDYADGMKLTLTTRDRNSKLAEALQSMLGEIGIEVELNIEEFAVYLQDMQAGNTEVLIGDVNTDNMGEPSKCYTGFSLTANAPSSIVTDEKWNQLIEDSYVIDTDERVKVLEEIQDYAKENCFFIPLMERIEVWCFNSTVLPSDFNCYYGGNTNFAVEK